MKKLLIAIGLLISGTLSAQYPAGSPVSCHGRLKVNGFQLTNQNDQPIQLRGMSSHGLQWYGQFMSNGSIGTLASDWQAQVIRASMYVSTATGGYLSNDGIKNTVKDVVSITEQYGIYAIIDWHVVENPVPYKEQAKAFFQEMATLYKDKKHVIYEICNEPLGVSWDDGTANDLKSYAEYIISAIRAIDPNNLIIVGTPFYSQDVDVVSGSPLNPTTYPNVIYTLHVYAQSHDYLMAKFKQASDKIPMIVTEFGPGNADGGGPLDTQKADEWLNLFAGNNTNSNNPGHQIISWCNWSLSNKAEASAALKATASSNGGWSNNDLTESGLYIKDKMVNPAVASLCDATGPFNLNLNSTSGGTAQVVPAKAQYNKGESVTITATPDNGWEFLGWTGHVQGSQNPITINMTSDKIIKAVFANPNNLVQNGDFSNGTANWLFKAYSDYGAVATGNVTGGEFKMDITNAGSNDWNVQFYQEGIHLTQGKKYVLTFDAYASEPRQINPNIGKATDPYTGYSKFPLVDLTTTKTTYSQSFVMTEATDANARLEMNVGFYSTASVSIDNIIIQEVASDNSSGPYILNVKKTTGGSILLEPNKSVYNAGDQVKITAQPYTGYKWKAFLGYVNEEINNPITVTMNSDININVLFADATELIKNGSISTVDSWTKNNTGCGVASFALTGGQMEVGVVQPGANYYCVQIVQTNLPIINGTTYKLSFDAWTASNPRNINVNIGSPTTYKSYSNFVNTAINTTKQTYTAEFTMADPTDNAARIEFNIGKEPSDVVYLDNISLRIKTDLPTGIAAVQKKNADWTVYPNPVNDNHLYVNLNKVDGQAKVSVYNLTGQMVYSTTANTAGVIDLNLNGLVTSGLYLVTVQDSQNTITQKVVVK